jgi:hypothetical protein
MYLVPTPLKKGENQSKIEDFFDKATKEIVVAGKKFDPDAKEDTGTHYGKTVFAHKVIAVHADKIKFTGFRPLLSRIVTAISAHAVKFPATPPAA